MTIIIIIIFPFTIGLVKKCGKQYFIVFKIKVKYRKIQFYSCLNKVASDYQKVKKYIVLHTSTLVIIVKTF